MKSVLVFLIFAFVLPGQAQLVLSLKEDLTLRDIFDYGFRPRHDTTSWSARVVTQDVVFSFKAYGITYPEIEATKIDFRVLENGKIATIQVHTKGDWPDLNYLTEEEAYEVAKKFNGEDRDRWTKTALSWSWPLFEKQSNFGCGVGLLKTYNEEKPYALGFTAKWNYPLSEIRTRQGPIEPPEGYEDWSMEPIPFVASGEKNKSKLESNSQKSIPKTPEEKQSTNEVVEGEKTGSLSWLYWFLGALILGGVGVLVWNSRKGSSTS